MTEVRPLAAKDLGPAADLCAEAFFHDPLSRHLSPDGSGRRAALTRVFRADLGANRAAGAQLLGVWNPGLAGLACWLAPGSGSPGPRSWLRQAPRLLPLLLRPGFCLRALRVVAALEASRPREPHAYLKVLAVSPRAQGSGVGKTLISEVAARASLLGGSLWLETFNPENLAYYAARGFVEAGRIQRPGQPPFWTFRLARP